MAADPDERFAFGSNWRDFVEVVDNERVQSARASLEAMLETTSLSGKSFVDVGCGSGLFSLAARQMGAAVRSFDYDADSVAATSELRRRYRPDDDGWLVEQGSVLDRAFLARLGTFDVVYSWGVLHHTGAMWTALDNVVPLVAPGGVLFIAIYNDQGPASRVWTAVKRRYNDGSPLVRRALVSGAGAYFGARTTAARLLGRRASEPRARGMSRKHDLVDWVGGWPFEVATPEEIFEFYRRRGFTLRRLKTCGGGLGCNEFVLERAA